MKPDCVAPYTGAWIEMARLDDVFQGIIVAPYTGAWIEISGIFLRTSALSRSLPTRERGLKFIQLSGQSLNSESLPTRERGLKYFQPVAILYVQRRSLHGSVD